MRGAELAKAVSLVHPYAVQGVTCKLVSSDKDYKNTAGHCSNMLDKKLNTFSCLGMSGHTDSPSDFEIDFHLIR